MRRACDDLAEYGAAKHPFSGIPIFGEDDRGR